MAVCILIALVLTFVANDAGSSSASSSGSSDVRVKAQKPPSTTSAAVPLPPPTVVIERERTQTPSDTGSAADAASPMATDGTVTEPQTTAPTEAAALPETSEPPAAAPQFNWSATAPPASEYCESRGHGSALLVMLGPATSGRTLENAIRNVAAPLCAWTVLVTVVDDAAKCGGQQPPPAVDAESEALLARVAAAVEPQAVRESLGPKLEALGAVRHLVSEDRRECGHIVEPPPPPRPLRHFGWEVRDGPCVAVDVGGLPAATRDGAVTSFQRGKGGTSWQLVGGADADVAMPWLPGLIKRVRQATFGRPNLDAEEDSTVVDVRGVADFAVVGGLVGPESEGVAMFDGAQMSAGPKPSNPGDTALSLKQRFPVLPSIPFTPQNSIEDRGLADPHPHELIRGAALNITARPVPRLAPSTSATDPATVLRKACPSPTRNFCQGNAFEPCVRRARWLSQVLITLDEQDSFGDRVAFADRVAGWTPTSGDDDAALSFPPPRKRFRPLPARAPSPPPPRCAASPKSGPTDGVGRSLALLYTGQLRTGRTVLPASLRQLRGNVLTAFLAISVPDLEVARDQLSYFQTSAEVPLGGLTLLNGTRTLDLRDDKAEYPHPRAWKTIPLLTTNNIVSQHYMLLAVSTMTFLYEQRCNVRFDFIVRTRPDSLYRWPLPPSALPRLYPGVFVVDGGWDYENGLSDQFAFGPGWLIGNFFDVAAVYPQILVDGRLPFTQVEMIHRFTLELLDFPFARLVRTVRRETFLVRPDHFHISAMHRGVLASLNVSLPPACRPAAPVHIDAQQITFVDGAPPCEGNTMRAPVPAPAPT